MRNRDFPCTICDGTTLNQGGVCDCCQGICKNCSECRASARRNPDLSYSHLSDDLVIVLSNIVTAFDEVTIGSKVTNARVFMETVADAIEEYDFEGQAVPGQGFIVLPPETAHYVSAGVATINDEDTADDYVLHRHREKVNAYLRRDVAERQRRNVATGCAVVVYTKAAYLRDPDIHEDPAEYERVKQSDATHVLVAVIAFCGPQSPLPPFRFIANLAGGNLEALQWDADTIRAKAKDIFDYFSKYTMVADAPLGQVRGRAPRGSWREGVSDGSR